MKKIFIAIITLFIAVAVNAQQSFNKHLAEARAAYAAGKLDDTRFAMQQMMQNLDSITGTEVLKLLPKQMLDQKTRDKMDNVSGASGFFGVLIHREYNNEPMKNVVDSVTDKTIELDIISNSPLVGTINGLLSLPFMGNNPDMKIVKISGYKALLQKTSGDGDKPEFEMQLPLNNALVTLKAPGRTQDELIKMANTIPVSEIAKLIQ